MRCPAPRRSRGPHAATAGAQQADFNSRARAWPLLLNPGRQLQTSPTKAVNGPLGPRRCASFQSIPQPFYRRKPFPGPVVAVVAESDKPRHSTESSLAGFDVLVSRASSVNVEIATGHGQPGRGSQVCAENAWPPKQRTHCFSARTYDLWRHWSVLVRPKREGAAGAGHGRDETYRHQQRGRAGSDIQNCTSHLMKPLSLNRASGRARTAALMAIASGPSTRLVVERPTNRNSASPASLAGLFGLLDAYGSTVPPRTRGRVKQAQHTLPRCFGTFNENHVAMLASSKGRQIS